MLELLALGAAVALMKPAGAEGGSSSSPSAPNKLGLYDALFKKYAAQYGVDWRLLKTIAMNESSLGQNSRVARGLAAPSDIEGSKSTDGKSWGLMQFTLPTARMYGSYSEKDLNNPEISIMLAAKHFDYLLGLFSNNERDAVMSYNHGEGNQKKFIAAEKNATLKPENYPAGRAYWDKYQKNRQYLLGKNEL